MRLTVGRKLMSLAGLGVALTLVVGGFGYAGTQRTAAQTRALVAGEARIVEHAGSVRAHILSLRRFEKDLYLNLGDAPKEADYLKKWEEQRTQLAARLDALERLATR